MTPHAGRADDAKTIPSGTSNQRVQIDVDMLDGGRVDVGDDHGAAHALGDALVDRVGEIPHGNRNDRERHVVGEVGHGGDARVSVEQVASCRKTRIDGVDRHGGTPGHVIPHDFAQAAPTI